MSRPRVLVTQPIHEAGLALLRERAEVVVAPDPSAATLARLARDAVGLSSRCRTCS